MGPREPKRSTRPPGNQAELFDSVARIEERVTTICDDLIPPVARAAGEARDRAILLTERQAATTERVEKLEGVPAVSQPCTMVKEHAERLSASERDVAGLSRWRWFLMSAVVIVITGAIAWSADSATEMATVQASSRESAEKLKTHASQLKSLEAQRRRDIEVVVRTLENVPTQVKQAIPEPDIDDALDELLLTTHEDRVIREIIQRGQRRKNGDHGKSR